jgi:hypothetical protein
VLAREERPRIRLTYPIIGPAANTSAVMPAPHSVTMNRGLYAPAALGPMGLLAKIDEQAALMQEAIRAAIAAGKTIIVSPTLMTLDPSIKVTEKGFTLSPTGWSQLVHAAKVTQKPSVTPLLLAAGALLALKFLK